MINVHCKNCGKQFDGNYAYCPYCATKEYQGSSSLEATVQNKVSNYQSSIKYGIGENEQGWKRERPEFKNPFHDHGIIDDGKPEKETSYQKFIWIIGISILVCIRIAFRID